MNCAGAMLMLSCSVSGHSHIHSTELSAWSCWDVAPQHLAESFLLPSSVRPEERCAGVQILESCGSGQPSWSDSSLDPLCLQGRTQTWPGAGWLSGAGLFSCSASSISSQPEHLQTSKLWTSHLSSWRPLSWASCVSFAVEILGLTVWTSAIRLVGKWPLEKSFNLSNTDICWVGSQPALFCSLHSFHVKTEVPRLELSLEIN